MSIDLYYFIIIAIFFIVGFLLSYLLKLKKKKRVGETVPLQIDNIQIDNNLEIIEVLENKKQLQIDNIILKLNDIQIRLDLLESKVSQSKNHQRYENIEDNIIKNITKNQGNTSHHNEINDITKQYIPKKSLIEKVKGKSLIINDKHNATEHYILKIILKEPLTSNEIKNAIGRTREHTSRLMKKLYELKLVDRDITTKPFKYKLTEQGKKYIGEQVEKNEINEEKTLKSSSYTNDSIIDLTK
ncbi:MAG TPA: helix-turn-helix domain-containing protein [Nitrososphaeraceae archaeon]|nr:helix-turn-helix domain-containing protein [Nitrososphaeraceae archaeon]